MMNQNPTDVIKSECGLCKSSIAHLIERRDRHRNDLRVVVCGNCGVVHNDPIPTASELSSFYKDEYRLSYKKTREPKLRHSARYFPAVSHHIEKYWEFYKNAKQILDVGSGSGEFVYLMRALGKDAAGLEPSKDYAEFCQKCYGLDVVNGEIDNFTPPTLYDHIRLHHVVEHLRDPIAHLRHVSKWLNKNGIIYVSVPDFERYCCVKTPGSIFHFGHIYNFDRDSFLYIVESAGLKVLERTGPTSAFVGIQDQPSSNQVKPRLEWDIPSKIECYQLHKVGKLKAKSRIVRFFRKASRALKVHVMIKFHGTHLKIAQKVATNLRESLNH